MTTDPTAQERQFAEAVFRQYAPQLHRFLLRRLAVPQDVDDLAQEVFIRLARLERPELVRKPQAYLFSVASNLIREFKLRAERDNARLTFDSDTADEQAERPAELAPDELGERLNLARQIDCALEQLPPMQRAVLLLIKRDGLSHKEAAKRTGLNVRVVERYVIEATARLMTLDWDR